MNDGDEDRTEMTRRAFLLGGFLSPRGADSESNVGRTRDPRRCGDSASPEPSETRGPAVDVDAIVGRAEAIAGVGSSNREETSHPAHQETAPDRDEENDE